MEALEKELELVLRKSDLLAEKLDDKEDVNYVVFEDGENEVSTTLRSWRTVLLNKSNIQLCLSL